MTRGSRRAPAGGWLTPEQLEAWRGLQRMQGRLATKLNRELLASSGLSLSDYAVLVVLSEAPEGRMRAFELGLELGWEKSRLSHHVTRMVGRGLAERQRCPSDNRGLFVAVTDRGRRALADAAPAHVESVRRAFIDLLSPDQISALAGISRTVLDALGAECPRAEGVGGAGGSATPAAALDSPA